MLSGLKNISVRSGNCRQLTGKSSDFLYTCFFSYRQCPTNIGIYRIANYKRWTSRGFRIVSSGYHKICTFIFFSERTKTKTALVVSTLMVLFPHLLHGVPKVSSLRISLTNVRSSHVKRVQNQRSPLPAIHNLMKKNRF